MTGIITLILVVLALGFLWSWIAKETKTDKASDRCNHGIPLDMPCLRCDTEDIGR